MQAVRRPPEKVHAGRQRERKQFRLAGLEGGVVIFLISLFCFCSFVQQLEGFDGDTIFLAIYCSVLLAFSIESFIFGLTTR